MTQGPEWFAPKRHGFGSGWPTAWQGWAVMLAFLVACAAIEIVFHDRPEVAIAVAAPIVVLFLFVVERTTPGGWTWRSRNKD